MEAQAQRPDGLPPAGDSPAAGPRRVACFTVIATRDRPDDLGRTIKAVSSSRLPAHQLIVSDGSTGSRAQDVMTSSYPRAVLMEGPRNEPSARRNTALLSTDGTHVLSTTTTRYAVQRWKHLRSAPVRAFAAANMRL